MLQEFPEENYIVYLYYLQVVPAAPGRRPAQVPVAIFVLTPASATNYKGISALPLAGNYEHGTVIV